MSNRHRFHLENDSETQITHPSDERVKGRGGAPGKILVVGVEPSGRRAVVRLPRKSMLSVSVILMMLMHGRVPLGRKDSKFFAANGCIPRILPLCVVCRLGCENWLYFCESAWK